MERGSLKGAYLAKWIGIGLAFGAGIGVSIDSSSGPGAGVGFFFGLMNGIFEGRAAEKKAEKNGLTY